MSDKNRFEEEPVNYSDLIFDWGNPSAPVKKTANRPVPQKKEAAKRTDTVRPEVRTAVPAPDEEEIPVSKPERAAGQPAASRLGGLKALAGKAQNKDREEAPAEDKGRTRRAEMIKRSRRRAIRNRIIVLAVVAAVVAAAVFLVLKLAGVGKPGFKRPTAEEIPDYIQEEYLSVNSYSRPGISTHKLTGIVIHNTAEPGMTAMERRDYYEGLAESHETRASVNYLVGLNGEIIVCVPPGEVAYASNDRNLDTISIEFCHPDDTGTLTEETYASMTELIKFLCGKYSISTDNVIRHYDVTGKLCPKYYVEDQEAWDRLLSDIKS